MPRSYSHIMYIDTIVYVFEPDLTDGSTGLGLQTSEHVMFQGTRSNPLQIYQNGKSPNPLMNE